jgi:hypothetical protein
MLLGMPSIGVDACSHPIWISWIPPSCLLWTCPTTKVVKINVTWPFCVAHHINVSLDTRNNMLTFRLPPLQLLPKNKIWSPILWRPKIFGCQPYDNQNISNLTLQWLKGFGHQTYNNRKISIVTLAIMKFFRSPSFPCVTLWLAITLNNILRKKKNYGNSNISPCKNIIFRKSPIKETKILQDITTLSLIPSFNTS